MLPARVAECFQPGWQYSKDGCVPGFESSLHFSSKSNDSMDSSHLRWSDIQQVMPPSRAHVIKLRSRLGFSSLIRDVIAPATFNVMHDSRAMALKLERCSEYRILGILNGVDMDVGRSFDHRVICTDSRRSLERHARRTSECRLCHSWSSPLGPGVK